MRVPSEAKGHMIVSEERGPRGAGLDLARLGGGVLRMGAAGLACEGPVHEVFVYPFSIGRRPVSRVAYQRFLEENPREPLPRFWGAPPWSDPEAPVVGVSWEEARRFAAWAGCRLP